MLGRQHPCLSSSEKPRTEPACPFCLTGHDTPLSTHALAGFGTCRHHRAADTCNGCPWVQAAGSRQDPVRGSAAGFPAAPPERHSTRYYCHSRVCGCQTIFARLFWRCWRRLGGGPIPAALPPRATGRAAGTGANRFGDEMSPVLGRNFHFRVTNGKSQASHYQGRGGGSSIPTAAPCSVSRKSLCMKAVEHLPRCLGQSGDLLRKNGQFAGGGRAGAAFWPIGLLDLTSCLWYTCRSGASPL